METEERRRLIKLLASNINDLVTREKSEIWYLAAGKEINHQVLAELNPDVKARLKKNVPADLVKVDKSELLRHF